MTDKDQAHKELFDKAHAAGMAAGNKHVPTPMVVGTPKNLMGSLLGGDGDGFDTDKPVYYVPQGVCGFAWIVVRPGTSSFAKWLMKNDGYHNYGGGTAYWVGEFGQSMECKAAYASAFASVLQDAGIKAYSQSRMD